MAMDTSDGLADGTADETSGSEDVPGHFELSAGAQPARRFAGAGPALLAFVKDDCPTCQLVLPLLVAMAERWGAATELFVVGQTADGNRAMEQRMGAGRPFDVLDDLSLKVSFDADVETVPTLFLLGAAGDTTTLIGFDKDEWQTAAAHYAATLQLPEPIVDWAALPDWRPGCGSLSVDPIHADRLRAEAEGSPLRARKLTVGSADDPFEFLFDQGFSDGLPVVPPTPERVLRMLDGTHRDAQDTVALVPPNLAPATVEKVAINAVMAGCRPEYLPVVITALEAACTDDYNIHGVMATTMGASPVVVVNGPIRHQLGMNMELGALGQGNRANATIGRALRLILRNVGGAVPGGTERSTLGNSGKFTQCFAEWEERNPWGPLHVERGFEAEDSVVTLFTMSSGPTLIVDQDSRDGHSLGASFGLCLDSAFHPKSHFATDVLVVICPEHVDTFVSGGYDKAAIRERIQAVTARPMRELMGDENCRVGLKPEQVAKLDAAALDRPMAKFRSPEDIHLVVAGSNAGKFSGAFHGWATGSIGSIMVSRKIDSGGV